MTIAGYRPNTTDDVDDRGTPPDTFKELSEVFGPFNLDVAANLANKKCDAFFGVSENGLVQSWSQGWSQGRSAAVWCNPPYSDIRPWVEKAWREYRACRSVTMLLPAVRQEQPYWQELVEPFRDRCGSPLRSMFLRGRRSFVGPDGVLMKTPPFGVVALDWRKDREDMGPKLAMPGSEERR